MINYPSDKTLQLFTQLAQAVGSDSFHVAPVYVCDHCHDDDKEAFPYGVDDANGRHWDVLCNECFDALGCVYDEANEDELWHIF